MYIRRDERHNCQPDHSSTMPYIPPTSIHEEIHNIAGNEDSSRSYLFTSGVLKTSTNCSCNQPMVLSPCSATKSADLHIWKCRSCKKSKTIRSDSVLAGANLSFKHFLLLLYYFAAKSLTNVEVSSYTGLSTKAVGYWRSLLSNVVANWFLQNSAPLGGPGLFVEIDEA